MQCGNLCGLHENSSCEASHLKYLPTVGLCASAAAAILVEGVICLQGMQLQIPSACKCTLATESNFNFCLWQYDLLLLLAHFSTASHAAGTACHIQRTHASLRMYTWA